MYSVDIVLLFSLSQNVPKSLIKVLSNVPLFPRTLPKDCQMLFFTETYNHMVKKFAWSVAPNAIDPLLHRSEEWFGNTKHYYVDCKHCGEKLKALSNIYGVVSIGHCIVFCQVSTVNTAKPYPLF